MKKILMFLVPLVLSFSLSAQDTTKARRFEIVLNITNAISRFSGNGVRNLNEDPYMIALKWRNKTNKRAFRLGFNETYSSLNTQLFPGERRTRDFYFSPILGYEWRRHLDEHFMFFFGIDARAGFRDGSVQLIDGGPSPTQVITSQERGYGAGPFCGFVWKINKRVSLFTEANLYAQYTSTYRVLDDGFMKTELENSHKMTFSPVVPTSLFLSINF